jgi:hypothetical protein
MEKMDLDKKKVAGRDCPEFRASFVHLFKPHAFNDQPEKYSLVMLFSKSTDLKELKRAAHNAAIEKWGADKTKWPKNLRMPFRDGDEKADYAGYSGTITVSASSKKKIQVVGNRKDESGRFPVLTNEDEFDSCDYGRATLIAFAYDQMGNRGVGFSVQSVQKTRDGERFAGRRQAEEEFDDSSNDEASYDDSGF